LYSDQETILSKDNLRQIFAAIPQPCCLVGGWAVYFTLNDRFKELKGREYQGSRDIDLGFHLDPKWTRKEFKNSPLSRALTKLNEMGFKRQAYRFFKSYRSSDMHELTDEESRSLPEYEKSNLFIDILVDTKATTRFRRAGSFLDQPLLAEAFGGKSVIYDMKGISVMMPTPEMLILLKVKSFPDRTQDDKRTKDLTDLCALLLFSGAKLPNLTDTQEKSSLKAPYKSALDNTGESEWEKVAKMLDIQVPTVKRAARRIQ